MYYVNDGVYGSFNCIMFDHVNPLPSKLIKNGQFMDILGDKSCSIWGPTCDSIDCISKSCLLPELDVGDWMVFEGMGAYSNAAASCFNGFKKSRLIYLE